jgi:hypothetical protein
VICIPVILSLAVQPSKLRLNFQFLTSLVWRLNIYSVSLSLEQAKGECVCDFELRRMKSVVSISAKKLTRGKSNTKEVPTFLNSKTLTSR